MSSVFFLFLGKILQAPGDVNAPTFTTLGPTLGPSIQEAPIFGIATNTGAPPDASKVEE